MIAQRRGKEKKEKETVIGLLLLLSFTAYVVDIFFHVSLLILDFLAHKLCCSFAL